MEKVRNLVVISGKDDNPSSFTTRIEPVKLEEGVEIAVRSIFYGSIKNITGANSTIKFRYKYPMNRLNPQGTLKEPILNIEDSLAIKILEGKYNTAYEILLQIEKEMNKLLSTHEVTSSVKATFTNKSISLKLPTTIKIVNDGDGPWELLGIAKPVITGTLSFQNFNIENTNICFIYSNIVENSYINQFPSRLLAVFPVITKSGYHHFEFKNPSYKKIEIHQFKETLIELRDLKGQLVEFEEGYKTAVELHFKSIKG